MTKINNMLTFFLKNNIFIVIIFLYLFFVDTVAVVVISGFHSPFVKDISNDVMDNYHAKNNKIDKGKKELFFFVDDHICCNTNYVKL